MNKGSRFIKIHKSVIFPIITLGLCILIPIVFFAIFIVNFYLQIYPNVSIQKVSVSGLTEKQAIDKVTNAFVIPEKITVTPTDGSDPLVISTKEIEANYDTPDAVRNAYRIGRSGVIQVDIPVIFLRLFLKRDIPLTLTFNEQKIQDIVETLNAGSTTKPVPPSFKYANSKITVENGQPGTVVDPVVLIEDLKKAIQGGDTNITLTKTTIDPSLTNDEATGADMRTQGLAPLTLEMHVDDTSKTIARQELVSLLYPKGGYNDSAVEDLLDQLEKEVNKDPQNPIFQFENSRAKEFSPAKDGLSLLRDETKTKILASLQALETQKASQTMDIAVSRVHPDAQTGDVNNLGIKELIGRGTSKFSGSIASRLFNVALASSRINGVLVAPGDTFSFANAIGDVSKYTGYKEAYIIQGGKTILGDGGGVCQVSTTLFRAVMNAGLPIVERHAHAYRVGYYEQDSGPGLDATVYVPTVDFKFKNDTANYILIQTKVDTKRATAEFSIYGTSDGRKSTITKPVVANVIVPPDDLYVDDPTLPLGKINQIEHRANGAKVSFDYTVTREGSEIYKKTFVSTYQPWQAVYMRGIGPAQ